MQSDSILHRHCIVGVGVRGINMFLKPLVRDYADVAQVVALWGIAFKGSKGRLEAAAAETFYTEYQPNFAGRGRVKRSIDPNQAANGDTTPATADEIRFYPICGGVESEWVPRASGGHGGGDVRLREMLFRPDVPDPLGHAAGSRAGAMSILIGVAANRSMVPGAPVWIDDLLNSPQVEQVTVG